MRESYRSRGFGMQEHVVSVKITAPWNTGKQHSLSPHYMTHCLWGSDINGHLLNWPSGYHTPSTRQYTVKKKIQKKPSFRITGSHQFKYTKLHTHTIRYINLLLSVCLYLKILNTNLTCHLLQTHTRTNITCTWNTHFIPHRHLSIRAHCRPLYAPIVSLAANWERMRQYSY